MAVPTTFSGSRSRDTQERRSQLRYERRSQAGQDEWMGGIRRGSEGTLRLSLSLLAPSTDDEASHGSKVCSRTSYAQF